MKDSYKSWAWIRLSLRRTRSLLRYSKNSVYPHQRRSARLLGRKRLRLLRTTPFFKPYLTATTKMSDFFAKPDSKSSQPPSVPGHSGSWTSQAGARCRYRLATMGPSRGAGQRAKALPSTCRTSSAGRSYAKQLWLPRAISWSWGTYRRLSREYSRGFVTTKICWTSSGQVRTLTPRSVRRCLAYPALLRTATRTYGSLQRARCWVVATASDGPHLRHNFLSASLGRPLYATTKTSRVSSA